MATKLLKFRILRSFLGEVQRRPFLVNYNLNHFSRTSPSCFKFASYSSTPAIIPRRSTSDADLKSSPELLSGGDPDKFGELIVDEYELFDEGDKQEEEHIKNKPRKKNQLTTKQYAQMIKEHLDSHRVKEALDVLEIQMLKQDRVKPENYIYNLLISGCARAGYTRRAFQLYNKMKQRDLKVTGGTYTSLFNACANSPSKENGLLRANHLREIMLEKGYEPNVSNYNAMIKAYGRCGDIQTAFTIADEMTEKKLHVGVETYNFLLQACASDSELGFRHALLVWHKMIRRRIVPDIFSFNLMLRVIRDCSVGDLNALEDIITKILAPKQSLPLLSDTSKIPKIAEASDSSEITIAENETKVDAAPNLLSLQPHLGSLVSISELKNPEDRLLLLGGQTGFLEEMKNARVTPGIETFTAMLEVVPSTTAAEKHIISMIRKIGLKVDIDFFNILIKKRSMRFDYQGAKEVLSMIRTAKLQPDIITYGVLALSCQTQQDARELIAQMQEKGVRMNIQILGAMLKQGAIQKNFDYVLEILQISLDYKIKPNEDFLRHLQGLQNRCFRLIESSNPEAKKRGFKKDFTTFREKYTQWRKEFGIEGLKMEDAIKKLKESPYQQFKENYHHGYEVTKNEKLQRKQKIRKYIKKVKLEQLPSNDKDEGVPISDINVSPYQKSV